MWLDKIQQPLLFQGSDRSKEYFEGWYYKQVSKDEKSVICFIPGVSLFKDDVHSFIQYIFVIFDDNNKKFVKTGYIRYDVKEFKYSNNPFMIQIGDSIFTESMASVKLSDGKINIEGKLKLGKFTPIKKSILAPNIMGYFAYIPKMECYHGVVSMNHEVSGALSINGKEVNFNRGKGYIEKDWGSSFPKKYIWIQCNNFQNENTSVFFSVADIPFMKKSFLGFISNLTIGGKEYRFATYNGSKVKIQSVTKEKIIILLENRSSKLKIEADLSETGELIAPKQGKMQEKIKEETSGNVKISLYDKEHRIIYEDCGNMAGIEIVGFKI